VPTLLQLRYKTLLHLRCLHCQQRKQHTPGMCQPCLVYRLPVLLQARPNVRLHVLGSSLDGRDMHMLQVCRCSAPHVVSLIHLLA
jgi:hypothetical protein